MKRALNEAAMIAERDWPGLDLVIPRKGKKVIDSRDGWRRGAVVAKLKGLLVHDLRRSAARNMRLAGVPEVEIMKMAGWRTRSMFERYQIVDPKDVRRAGEQAEQWMEKQEGAQPESVNCPPPNPPGRGPRKRPKSRWSQNWLQSVEAGSTKLLKGLVAGEGFEPSTFGL